MRSATRRVNPASIIPAEVVSAVNGFVIKLMAESRATGASAKAAPNPNLFYKNYLATDEKSAAGGTDYVFHKEGPIVYGYNVAADNTTTPFAYASEEYTNPVNRNNAHNLLIIATQTGGYYDNVVANYLTNFKTFQRNAEISSEQAKALYTKLDGNRKAPGAVRKLFRSGERKPYVSTDTIIGKDKVYVSSDGGFYKKDGSGGYSILSQEDLGKVLTDIQNQNKEIFKTARVKTAPRFATQGVQPRRRVAFPDPQSEYEQQLMTQNSAQQRSFSRPDDQRQQQHLMAPEPRYAPRTAVASEDRQLGGQFSQPAQPRDPQRVMTRGLDTQSPQAPEREAPRRTLPKLPSQQAQQPQQQQAQQRVPQQTFAAPPQKLGATCDVNKTESKKVASGKVVNTFRITFTGVNPGSLAQDIGLRAGNYLEVRTYRQSEQEVLSDLKNFNVGTGDDYLSSKLYSNNMPNEPIDENFFIGQRIDQVSSQRDESRMAQQQRVSAPIRSRNRSFSLAEPADQAPYQSSRRELDEEVPVDRRRDDRGAARSDLATFAAASQRNPFSPEGSDGELEEDAQLGVNLRSALASRRQIPQQGGRDLTSQRRLPVTVQQADSRVSMAYRSMVSGGQGEGFASRPSGLEKDLDFQSLSLGDQLAQLKDLRRSLQRGASSAQAGGREPPSYRPPQPGSLYYSPSGEQNSLAAHSSQLERREAAAPSARSDTQGGARSLRAASPPPLPPAPSVESLREAGMTRAALPAGARQPQIIAGSFSAERDGTRESLRMSPPSRPVPTRDNYRLQADSQQHEASDRSSAAPNQEPSAARAQHTLLLPPAREQSGRQDRREVDQTRRLQFVPGSAQGHPQRPQQEVMTTHRSHASVAAQRTADPQPRRPTAQQQKFETQGRKDSAEQPRSRVPAPAEQQQFAAHSRSEASTRREEDTAAHAQHRDRRTPSSSLRPHQGQGGALNPASLQHW